MNRVPLEVQLKASLQVLWPKSLRWEASAFAATPEAAAISDYSFSHDLEVNTRRIRVSLEYRAVTLAAATAVIQFQPRNVQQARRLPLHCNGMQMFEP